MKRIGFKISGSSFTCRRLISSALASARSFIEALWHGQYSRSKTLSHHPGIPRYTLNKPHANEIICALLLLPLAITIFQDIFQVIVSSQDLFFLGWTLRNASIYTKIYVIIVAFNALVLVGLVWLDLRGNVIGARFCARLAIATLIISLLASLIVNGLAFSLITYLFQFVCVVAYQLYNDPNLKRNADIRPVPLVSNKHLPPHWKHKTTAAAVDSSEAAAFDIDTSSAQKASACTDVPDAVSVSQTSAKSAAYIPLNFYNMFWIFIVASVLGLAIEMLFCFIFYGEFKSRAGLLWGPFSPIYGFGALLMTIVLNRVWNRNALVIIIIAALIGAAFEFAVSWYLETFFGIVSWDYSTSPFNLAGRTDLGHAIGWGLLGMVYIRLILPSVMRIVDLIALRWRAAVTIIALVFMLFDGSMTLLALDCWSQREAGVTPTTQEQQFFATYFDNDYMQTRFANMNITQKSMLPKVYLPQ